MAALRGLVARLSLRARLTLISALAVALAVGAVSVTAYVLVRHQLRAQVDASFRGQQAQNLVRLAGSPRGGLPRGAPGVRAPALFAATVVVLPDGTVTPLFAAGDGATLRPSTVYSQAAQDQGDPFLRDDYLTDGAHVRAAVYPVVLADTGQRAALVFARSLAEVDTSLARLRLLLVLVGGCGVLVAAAGGLAVARAGLRPVDRLTAAAEHVAATEELDVPIAVTGHDEVARLARSFNAMTAALSASRARQQQLVADAGHELRTPLTSLRTNLDLLERSERSGRPLPPEDRTRLLRDVREQTAELGTLVGELVDLARDERTDEQPSELDLAAVVARAASRARLRAGGRPVLTGPLAPWHVLGQPAALERAVVNLVDNALKFSPPGGAVEVSLEGGVVTVADRGPGISPEDRAHVFDRFYRATAARGLPGSGLGLAIVAQTARAHGGAVRVVPREGGGTLAQLWVPGTTGAG